MPSPVQVSHMDKPLQLHLNWLQSYFKSPQHLHRHHPHGQFQFSRYQSPDENIIIAILLENIENIITLILLCAEPRVWCACNNFKVQPLPGKNILKRKLSHFYIFSSSCVEDVESLLVKHFQKKTFTTFLLSS